MIQNTSNGTKKGQFVLVVDDDDSVRETLKFVLEMSGYEVKTAANGLEAKNVVDENSPPWVILLDLMMPVMNGMEFLKIRETDPNLASIPVIVVSAFENKALAARADSFISKPVELGDLLETVERYRTPYQKLHRNIG